MNRAPHNILGVAALSTSFLSAIVYGGFLVITGKLPIYAIKDGIGFTISMIVWQAICASIALGIVGTVCFIASCLAHRHAWLSLRSLATLVFLIPSAYTLFYLLKLLQFD